MTTETATITIRETDAPSRSKGRGWARLDLAQSVFASTRGATADLPVGTELDVVIGTELRRASRTEKDRRTVRVVVTGIDTDVVEVRLGSPQAYVAVVVGVSLVA